MLRLRHGQLLIPDLVLVVVIAPSALRVFFFIPFLAFVMLSKRLSELLAPLSHP